MLNGRGKVPRLQSKIITNLTLSIVTIAVENGNGKLKQI